MLMQYTLSFYKPWMRFLQSAEYVAQVRVQCDHHYAKVSDH